MVSIPGMQIAVSPAGEADLQVFRTEPNLWWLAFGSLSDRFVTATTPRGALPSEVVKSIGAQTEVTVAKLELDACGVWLTVANAEAARPVVVRRAGWVDVRGHPFEPDQPLCDDRVGLGPGDALVFARPGDGDTTTDEFLDCLLRARDDVNSLRDVAIEACHPARPAVAVLGVPSDLGPDSRQRVADAIGVAVDELDLPGYPLADLQPELWSVPPRPPRLARLELRDMTSVRDVRNLLDRLVGSWRLSSRLDDEGLKLAASELASNAIMHAGSPETTTVRLFGQGVRIEVDDRSSDTPKMRAESNEFGGRGLHVVDAVASSWGVEARPTGKRVWCEIAFS